tara:strand:+ start:183 stop:1487 length:1305 start_codon:yes stop_codon:yes gene_type:complete
MLNKIIKNYFFVLFSLIPISLVLGSTVSLINILLIDIIFLFILIYEKNFLFVKNNAIKCFLVLYIYLVFNSFISVDHSVGLARNLGFLRIIILFIAMNYFFKDQKFFQKVLTIWSIIFIIILIDVFIEIILGRNILGYESPYRRRIVSFFKDEPIVGGYLNAFYLIIIGFLYSKFGKNFKKPILIISILAIIGILLTGERANFIKAFLGIILFYSFFDLYKIKHKFYFLTIVTIFISGFIFSNDFLKNRYIDQMKSLLLDNRIYYDQYRSGYKVFKEYKFFGVGNKNYRIVSCSKFEEEANKWIDIIGKPSDVFGQDGYEADFFIREYVEYRCNTHPHQIYLELLSEHGILGTIFILYIIYKLIISKFIFSLKSMNYIQLGSGIYIIFIFLPLVPSGAFFSDFLITLFALNVSIFYASNSNLNIFSNDDYNKKI